MDPATPRLPREIALIAAVARNGAIGRDNRLLFHDAADQRHFRATTQGCPVIMGRKTWDSLPARFRPLPGRRNVVVSRNATFAAPGAEIAAGLLPALDAVRNAPRVYVMGGAQLYAQALPLAQLLVLTEIDADLDGDAFFPPWERSDFVRVAHESHTTAEGVPFQINLYRRVDGGTR